MSGKWEKLEVINESFEEIVARILNYVDKYRWKKHVNMTDEYFERFCKQHPLVNQFSLKESWENIAEYLDVAQKKGASIVFIMTIGHGATFKKESDTTSIPPTSSFNQRRRNLYFDNWIERLDWYFFVYFIIPLYYIYLLLRYVLLFPEK